MKKNLIAAAIIGASVAVPVAQAAPIALPAGPIGIKFNNIEQISQTNKIAPIGGGIDPDGSGPIAKLADTEGNWGIFDVTNLQFGKPPISHTNTSASDFGLIPASSFWTDASGGEITGIFYGIQIDSATTATSGFIDIYWDDDNDLADGGAAARTAQNKYTTVTDGTFLIRIAFASGHVQGDSTHTVFSDIDLTSIGGAFSGKAFSYGNVVDVNGDGVIDISDGLWASSLNTDWFNVDPSGDGFYGGLGETRDLKFQNNFENNDSAAWNTTTNTSDGSLARGANSFDPVKVFAVPEPSILGLLGIALLGFGATQRRSKV